MLGAARAARAREPGRRPGAGSDPLDPRGRRLHHLRPHDVQPDDHPPTRIVFDTLRGYDSTRVVDSVRAAAKPAFGFAIGLSSWPAESYCSGLMSAAMQQVDPRVLLGRLQLARRCNVRVVLVPPRRLLTADGLPRGRFSVDSAKRLTDLYAAVLPADTILEYRNTIIGLNLADDYGCLTCWGGTAITQAQITEWAAYTRARLPGIPLGVRVTPDWVAAHPPLVPYLDYTWAQYATRKGEAQAYYDRAATIAERLGLRVVMGVNVENCYAGDSRRARPRTWCGSGRWRCGIRRAVRS